MLPSTSFQGSSYNSQALVLLISGLGDLLPDAVIGWENSDIEDGRIGLELEGEGGLPCRDDGVEILL